MRQLVFGTSLSEKTSKDRDFNFCRISGNNMLPIMYSTDEVVQRFDNVTICTDTNYYINMNSLQSFFLYI